MTKLSKLVLPVLAMIAVVGSAHALELGKPTPTRVVQGIFTGGAGEQIEFAIPEGRGLKLRDRTTGISYRLLIDKMTGDRVTFKVIDAATEQRVDGFDLALDGKAQSGKTLPISLTLTGITVQKRPALPVLQKSASAATTTVGDLDSLGSCCVGCGDWEVCCEPSPGWCCELECVGGDTCSGATGMVPLGRPSSRDPFYFNSALPKAWRIVCSEGGCRTFCSAKI